MIRIHVICGGQTEEAFVKELMVEPFLAKGIILLPALIGKPGHKGGNFKFERLLPEVRNRLLSDTACYCTTFFDFYGLPTSFPGKATTNPQDTIVEKATKVTEAMMAKLTEILGQNVMLRFIPFVQMYEFEGLLFSNPEKMAKGIDQAKLANTFKSIADKFDSPEHINDSPQTAPSKRILKVVNGYEKPVMGVFAALEVGLADMRERCFLFNQWLCKIELVSGNQD